MDDGYERKPLLVSSTSPYWPFSRASFDYKPPLVPFSWKRRKERERVCLLRMSLPRNQVWERNGWICVLLLCFMGLLGRRWQYVRVRCVNNTFTTTHHLCMYSMYMYVYYSTYMYNVKWHSVMGLWQLCKFEALKMKLFVVKVVVVAMKRQQRDIKF